MHRIKTIWYVLMYLGPKFNFASLDHFSMNMLTEENDRQPSIGKFLKELVENYHRTQKWFRIRKNPDMF